MRFKNLEDARAAGYTREVAVLHRGVVICSIDISGGSEYGYSYAVGVRTWRNWEPQTSAAFNALREMKFARAETVWLTNEPNQLGQPGSCLQMYSAESWASGVAAAKLAIDQWMDADTEAAESLTAYEAWRSETDRRQAAKILARAARRRNAIA